MSLQRMSARKGPTAFSCASNSRSMPSASPKTTRFSSRASQGVKSLDSLIQMSRSSTRVSRPRSCFEIVIVASLSIILTNVAVGPLEQLSVLVQLVFEQGLPQCFFHFAFTGMGGLPSIEPDCTNNFVDVIDDAPNHDRGLSVLG